MVSGIISLSLQFVSPSTSSSSSLLSNPLLTKCMKRALVGTEVSPSSLITLSLPHAVDYEFLVLGYSLGSHSPLNVGSSRRRRVGSGGGGAGEGAGAVAVAWGLITPGTMITIIENDTAAAAEDPLAKIKIKVREFYARFAPAKLPGASKAVEKYSSNFPLLFEKLVKQYPEAADKDFFNDFNVASPLPLPPPPPNPSQTQTTTIAKHSHPTNPAVSLLCSILQSVHLANSFSLGNHPHRQESPLVVQSVVLSGPPGVGKTTSINLAVSAFCSQLTPPANPRDLCVVDLRDMDEDSEADSGGTIQAFVNNQRQQHRQRQRQHRQLQRQQQQQQHQQRRSLPTIIFLDECETLLSPLSSPSPSYIPVLAHYLANLHNSPYPGGTVFVALTNHAGRIDESLRNPTRIAKEIKCKGPESGREKAEMLRKMLGGMALTDAEGGAGERAKRASFVEKLER